MGALLPTEQVKRLDYVERHFLSNGISAGCREEDDLCGSTLMLAASRASGGGSRNPYMKKGIPWCRMDHPSSADQRESAAT